MEKRLEEVFSCQESPSWAVNKHYGGAGHGLASERCD